MKRLLILSLVLPFLALHISCSGGPDVASDSPGSTNVTIRLGGTGPAPSGAVEPAQIPEGIEFVQFTISGPGMVTIGRTVPVAGQEVVTETFSVRNGQDRYFYVQADDVDRNALFSGNSCGIDLDGTPIVVTIDTEEYATGQPPVFLGLSEITDTTPTSLTLTWPPAVDDKSCQESIQYLIYLSDTPGGQDFSEPTFVTPPGATSFTVPGLDPDTTLYALVRSRDVANNTDGNMNEQSGTAQEPVIPTCRDVDGDGYGNPGRSSCPAGSATDCDDNNPAIHPGVADTDCDNVDENCNGVPDDGYVATTTSCGVGECAATGQLVCQGGSEVNTCIPGAPGVERPFGTPVCSDSLDNDCDGAVDSADPGCVEECLDNDNDGFTTCDNDCNDGNPVINPAATDTDCDGLDDNCDGIPDEGYLPVPVTCGVGACSSTGQIICANGVTNNTCAPGIPGNETCNDTDDDCDGAVDEGVKTVFYHDGDSDGFGDPNDIQLACTAPAGYISDNTDCDDSNAAVSPGDTEGPFGQPTCSDLLDNDCDTLFDSFDSDCISSCRDNDGDGYGNPGNASCPNGSAVDCNDSSAAINPGAAEICNNIDDDCDGTADDGFDVGTACGLGICAGGQKVCTNDGTTTFCSTDDLATFETCNGLDDDCDGTTDEDALGNPLTQTCYTGPPGTSGVGVCTDGLRTCVSGEFGACVGDVTPTTEICDSQDDDCDGEVDEGFNAFPSCETVYYVDADATGAGDGSSWSDAFNHPQDAMDEIEKGSEFFRDQVWVAGGTYTRRTIDTVPEIFVLLMSNSVEVYGGFDGTENSPSNRDFSLIHTVNETALDGEGQARVVVVGGDNAVLDGFTIKRGNAQTILVATTALIALPDLLNGGGMYNSNVSMDINNCHFEDNQADGAGGAIYQNGDAINDALNITNCTFKNNTSGGGGAIYSVDTDLSLTNSLFTGNSAGSFDPGGGIYIAGGEVGTAKITNCTFSENTAEIGGAIFNQRDTTVVNSILWGDSPDEISDAFGAVSSVSFSDVEGGFPGLGNIDDDPLFVNALGGDYRLQNGSRAIDSGTASDPDVPGVDIDGNPRPQGAGVDMGAYESPFTVTLTYRLTIEKAGFGSGTVVADSGSIDCGAVCFDLYAPNTDVTLTATPDPLHFFDSWSGDPDCADEMVTMDADKTCIATFLEPSVKLDFDLYGEGIIMQSNAHDFGNTQYLVAFFVP